MFFDQYLFHIFWKASPIYQIYGKLSKVRRTNIGRTFTFRDGYQSHFLITPEICVAALARLALYIRK